jgi:DNA-binding MarR family transcriptional regulator
MNQEKDVMELIFRLSRMLRRRPEPQGEEQHPPRSVMRILRLLEKNETMRSGDVAKALDIRAGSVTTTLSKMEESNLIYRERDSSDSRIVNLSLTEKGQETLMKSRRYFEKRRKQINEVLTEEERNQFIAVGEKLIAFLGDDS